MSRLLGGALTEDRALLAKQAAQRKAARGRQAQLDVIAARAFAESENVVPRAAEPPIEEAPASARRAKGQEAREEQQIYERTLLRAKGREALEEKHLKQDLERPHFEELQRQDEERVI